MSGKVTVTAASLGTSGRHVIDARHNHFIVDSTEASGGTGEAPVATELFLASLATCALAVITDAARRRTIAAREYRVEVSTTVDSDDSTRFKAIDFRFRIGGVGKGVAEDLVGEFTRVCPIYNTAARTTPVSMSVEV